MRAAASHDLDLSAARLLGTRILVRREKAAEVERGIVIPDQARREPLQGKVVAIGQGRRTSDGSIMELDVKLGEVVLFREFSGKSIDSFGERLLMLREEEILGVVEA